MRKGGWILAILALAVSGAAGAVNGVAEMLDSESALQWVVQIANLMFGVSGLAGAVGLALKRGWSVKVAVAWAVSGATAATIASFAYHDPRFEQPDTMSGTVAAFASMLVLGALVTWAARVATRAPESASGTTTT